MKPQRPGTRSSRTRGGIPVNKQILEEAANWFVDFRAGDIDAGARQEFHAWLRHSPDHIQAYMDIAGTYAEVPAPSPDGKLDVEALLAYARCAPDANIIALTHREAAAHVGRGQTEAAAPPSFIVRRRAVLALAATLVLVVGSMSTWAYLQRGTYTTDIGEQRSIVLKDGSTVELNSNSTLRVRYGDDERHINLVKGQALFEVAKDAKHPFIVQTDRTRIRAIGTQFDVYRKTHGTVVTVVEGRVAVSGSVVPARRESSDGGEDRAPQPPPSISAQPGELLLAAGEQITVSAITPAKADIQAPHKANIAAATAWTSRMLIFDATSLPEVAEEFNRYTARRLVIASQQLDDFHVSGTYSSTNPESLLRFLRAQPGLELIETDREIRVSTK